MRTEMDFEAAVAGRDRVVDLIRVASICVVVFGHWLMAVVEWDDAGITGRNALDLIGGAWVLTWVLQVMPLFFFVGGFANATSLASAERRGEGYGAWLRARAERLLAPTVPFLAVWLGLRVVTLALDVHLLDPAFDLVARPLWFLAVYIGVIAAAPPMLQLHRAAPWRTLGGLATGAVLVDAVSRATGSTAIGKLNFAFAWLFAHQLGYLLADGTLASWNRRRFAGIAAGAFALLVALTGSGLYPASMVTLDEGRSNVTPPTICIVLLSVWLVSLVMLARPALARLLERRRVYTGVAVIGSMLMTVFLWHLTALLLGVALLYPLGFPQPEAGTAAWWALRPVWAGALLVLLIPLVAATARYEAPSRGAGGSRGARATTAVVLLVVGFACLAQFGLRSLWVAGPSAGLVVAARALMRTRQAAVAG